MFRLNREDVNAIKVCAELARHESGSRSEQSLSSQTLAHRCQLPRPFLSKTLQKLARAGLVRCQAGLHGGARLALAPPDISLYDIVQAVSGPIQLYPDRVKPTRWDRALRAVVRGVETGLVARLESISLLELTQRLERKTP